MDALPQKNRPSSTVRTLRGHKAAITVLHAVCKAECGEDSDDSGHFISGSADCTVISFTFQMNSIIKKILKAEKTDNFSWEGSIET
jgi:hypothetical protein